eukprot:scaffold2752_cov393-Prasinococcus_capsulatus_cf.AAC.42
MEVVPAAATSRQVLEGNTDVVLTFAEGYQPDGLLLIEMDDQLMNEIAQNGAAIKGEGDEDLVLCTHDTTYAMKMVNTSNTVLLFPPQGCKSPGDDKENDGGRGKWGLAAAASVSRTVELQKTVPRTEKLKRLLEDGALENDERDAKKPIYTKEDFQEIIQCSEEELDEALDKCEAFELDGSVRVLHKARLSEWLELTLLTIVEKDWVGFHIAIKLLEKEGSDGCTFEEFEALWTSKLPSASRPNLRKLLEGHALYWHQGLHERVKLFSLGSLPRTPQERFQALFAERELWLLEDIEPYVKDLLAMRQTVASLLMKYARKIQSTGGEPLYAKR